ncbi:hypothetical protein ACFXPS_42915, partial [Nocardia sp. NPDC059091]|uniref:hypothetical protein n=1 Tax=Nocardia sp. NPDC059091 TaxID=3346724 RepID=UPI0036809AF7
LAELADDLLGGVSSSRHVVNRPPAPILVHQNPHNRWTCSEGSSHILLVAEGLSGDRLTGATPAGRCTRIS